MSASLTLFVVCGWMQAVQQPRAVKGITAYARLAASGPNAMLRTIASL
jgi:hypothetical protein